MLDRTSNTILAHSINQNICSGQNLSIFTIFWSDIAYRVYYQPDLYAFKETMFYLIFSYDTWWISISLRGVLGLVYSWLWWEVCYAGCGGLVHEYFTKISNFLYFLKCDGCLKMPYPCCKTHCIKSKRHNIMQ